MPTHHPRKYSDYGLRARIGVRRASYRAAFTRFRNVQAAARYNNTAQMRARLHAAVQRRNEVLAEYESLSDELARRQSFVDTDAKAYRAALMLAYKTQR